jgi:tight adherence protein C
MSALVAALTTPTVAISLAVAVSAFIAVFTVASMAAVRRERAARIRVAAARTGRSAGPRRGGQASDDVMGLINALVRRVNVMKDRTGESVSQKLARAGWRSKDAVALYLFGKLILPLLFGLLALAYLFAVQDFGLPVMLRVAGAVGVALAGSWLPDVLVKNQAQKRAESIRKGLPDALDLMVICAEAGLSLDATFKRVAREIRPTSLALADEFGLTLLELRFMPERRRALENLAKRVELQGMTNLVNTLFQTEKFGTPLAQALRVLAAEMRDERMLRAEEKAARLPAVMTIPLIVFIMPALFIVLMGPAIMDVAAVFQQM